MLSFTQGKPIAVIKGGANDGEYLRLYEEGKKFRCCNKCSNECTKNKKCCK